MDDADAWALAALLDRVDMAECALLAALELRRLAELDAETSEARASDEADEACELSSLDRLDALELSVGSALREAEAERDEYERERWAETDSAEADAWRATLSTDLDASTDADDMALWMLRELARWADEADETARSRTDAADDMPDLNVSSAVLAPNSAS